MRSPPCCRTRSCLAWSHGAWAAGRLQVKGPGQKRSRVSPLPFAGRQPLATQHHITARCSAAEPVQVRSSANQASSPLQSSCSLAQCKLRTPASMCKKTCCANRHMASQGAPLTRLICEALSRCQLRVLAHYAQTPHFLALALAIGDVPVPVHAQGKEAGRQQGGIEARCRVGHGGAGKGRKPSKGTQHTRNIPQFTCPSTARLAAAPKALCFSTQLRPFPAPPCPAAHRSMSLIVRGPSFLIVIW